MSRRCGWMCTQNGAIEVENAVRCRRKPETFIWGTYPTWNSNLSYSQLYRNVSRKIGWKLPHRTSLFCTTLNNWTITQKPFDFLTRLFARRTRSSVEKSWGSCTPLTIPGWLCVRLWHRPVSLLWMKNYFHQIAIRPLIRTSVYSRTICIVMGGSMCSLY